ncbi:hypothetical protein APR41_04435 [Salegentibacter salinarum]|uniref:Methylamine utilisation protein MauE domain-containing protein n=1 Tax=Salegentibacter salinarum TaxID=447422 RepID=A0A2N0TUK1_9FLAO|nr:MauE/DoxX family redox-associated membrane protein [Salegentibacter salinarum]PKD18404.1 hypothetical protein APR41_04435 [Salegentibacter salinarum]SKB45203.1 DoxX protein [Salegentibacter salinarum]
MFFTYHQKYRLSEIIRFFLAILFIYTGATKLFDYSSFYDNLYNNPLINSRLLTNFLSIGVPILELIVGSLLLYPKKKLLGMIAAMGLLNLFTIYILGILFLSPYTPCSCGGIISLLSWHQHLYFNLGCIAIGLLGLYLMKNNKLKNQAEITDKI